METSLTLEVNINTILADIDATNNETMNAKRAGETFFLLNTQ